MNYTEKTYEYLEGLYAEDKRLAELKLFAKENNIPIMRDTVAHFLTCMVSMKRPQRILELGTAIGYSGSVMLLHSDACLTTLELDENSYYTAAENFRKFGLSDRVTQALGDANEQIRALTGTYDFVFLDYAKAQYIRLLPEILRRLERGGVLIADNVLFRGWITNEEKRRRRFVTIVKRMREFLAEIAKSEMLTTSIVPFADGVSISVKK